MVSKLARLGRWAYRESGLRSVNSTGRDAWLVIGSRSCRMLAYGSGSLVLALFFAELGVSDTYIGLFMTLTLAGDVVLGLCLTLVADRVGRRRTLLAGSLLMVASGAAFALVESYWVLLAAAVVGVVSATGGDFGPFRAVEESTVAELTTPDTRPDVLAWYITTSSLGSAVGTELAGRLVDRLRSRHGWTLVDAYHACFWLYMVMGAANAASSMLMSERCELRGAATAGEEAAAVDASEMEPWLDSPASTDDDGASSRPKPTREKKKKKKGRFAQISRETRGVMYALWALLVVDSLADGMVSMSLTTYYMDGKFDVSKSTLGDFLSASYFLAAASTVFAGPLSRHVGLVNTMVFTHVPSSAAVLLFPLPRGVAATLALLLVRVGLNNMDQAPRAALIAAVVRPEERTAVMGVTAMLRTLASATGPSVTGFLAGSDSFWVAFVAAGALRLAYDVGLFVMFINTRLHRHEPAPTWTSNDEEPTPAQPPP